MDNIQIALTDDHRLFRKGMVSLINQLPGYEVLFEAGDGEETMAKINAGLTPSILLLDINMPKMDGILTAEWMRANYPDIRIIVLSMHNEAEKVVKMVKLGIKGYLLKDAQPSDFEEALNTVASGQIYFPPFVTKHLVSNLNPATAPLIKLNKREVEFIKLAATELTYKQIAEKMFISQRTVDGYREHLFEKLNLKSRVGLVLYAIKNKVIEI